MKTKIINIKNKDAKDYTYIGRGSKYGNPFIIGIHGDRCDVIEKFRIYARDMHSSGEWSCEELSSLYGKTLGCFCKPLACHGDVLVEAINYCYNRLNNVR